MKGLRKRIIALAAVAVFAMTALAGCAGVKDSDIVATVGDKNITAKVATFYARWLQPDYEESYLQYQKQMWYSFNGQESDADLVMDWNASSMTNQDLTVEEEYKNSVMQSLQEMYLAEKYMGDYDVKLTDEDFQKIKETADAFLKANSEDVLEKISADKESVTEVLRLLTIRSRVIKAIEDGVDQNVPDEEVAQKRIRYVSFSKTKTDEDSNTVELTGKELEEVKQKAEAFLAGSKAAAGMEEYAEVQQITTNTDNFGADYKDEDATLALPKEVYEAADKLQEKEYAEVIDTDSAYYVVQLEVTRDEEATQTAKDQVISDRKTQAREDVVAKWKEETKITVNEKVWKKVKIRSLAITVKSIDESTATPSDATPTGTK